MTTIISVIAICAAVLFLIIRKGLIAARRDGREKENILEQAYRHKYPKE